MGRAGWRAGLSLPTKNVTTNPLNLTRPTDADASSLGRAGVDSSGNIYYDNIDEISSYVRMSIAQSSIFRIFIIIYISGAIDLTEPERTSPRGYRGIGFPRVKGWGARKMTA